MPYTHTTFGWRKLPSIIASRMSSATCVGGHAHTSTPSVQTRVPRQLCSSLTCTHMTHDRTQNRAHSGVQATTHAHTHACTHAQALTLIHTCTNTSPPHHHKIMHTHAHTCTYPRMHTCPNTHTHTHLHKHKPPPPPQRHAHTHSHTRTYANTHTQPRTASLEELFKPSSPAAMAAPAPMIKPGLRHLTATSTLAHLHRYTSP